MAVIVGIDEAGYGPILGPLTATASVCSVEDSLLKANLWDVLTDSVSKQKKGLRGRMLICDSKKAYNRKAGLGHLERTVLSVLFSQGFNGQKIGDLVEKLAPNAKERILEYPWYKEIDSMKLGANFKDIELASKIFVKNTNEKGVCFLETHSDCLDAGYYNKLVSKVKNKSTVLFTSICSLMLDLIEKYGNQNLHIIVDRQGGRTNYIQPLQKMFPDFSLRVIRVIDQESSYELKRGNCSAKIHFLVKGDDRFLPVALASMTSKYLRELLMTSFNGYFCDKNPEIVPTAGYWTDGQRFIKDLQQFLPELVVDDNILIRQK